MAEGFVCPKCGVGCYVLKGQKEYVRKQCHKHSSVTAGTGMHGSHLLLTVWFWAAFLVSRDKRVVTVQNGCQRNWSCHITLQKMRPLLPA